MDETDRRLLRELIRDPRLPMAQVAKRVGLSRPAVAERIHRLQRDHVIVGWRVDLDPVTLGLPYTVFFRIRPSAGQATTVEQIARALPAVVEGYRTTGEDCLLLKAHMSSIPEIERILAHLQRYGQTVASDVLSAVVPPRAPPLPADSP